MPPNAQAAARRPALLVKSQVKGYAKKSGTYVKPHVRKDKPGAKAAAPAPITQHPKPNENGDPVAIKYPTKPSAPSTWHSADAVATFVPGGDALASINGVSLTTWHGAPKTQAG